MPDMLHAYAIRGRQVALSQARTAEQALTLRKSLWEWSCEYVGDPGSQQARGDLILELLKENGLAHQSQVLEIGCGNLSLGAPLIRFLAGDHYIGLEPAGWLVETSLDRFPELLSLHPRFLWRTDFDASEEGRKFDFVASHSVLSHIAHWQLDLYLANTRKVVNEGAVMLASFRNDQYNSLHSDFQYPGVSTFRLPTVIAAGVHAGWRIEIMPEYRERMLEVAPHDGHDWLRAIAVPSLAELNERRIAEEEVARVEAEDRDEVEGSRRADLTAADEKRVREAGL